MLLQADTCDDGMPSSFDPGTVAALFDGNPAAVAVLDHDLRYTYVNPALERLNGLPVGSHLGRVFSRVLPGLRGQASVLRAVLADGKPREETLHGQTWAADGAYGEDGADQRFWRATYSRLDVDGEACGLMAIVVEITDLTRQREELEEARGHVALLSTAAGRIGTTLDMDTTCRELTAFVVPDFADVAAVDVFPSEVAGAGHLPPVFIDPDPAGARVVPVPVGPPLGTGFGGYRTASVPCGPGTVLFMYTDGLVERRDEDIDVSVGRPASLTLPRGGHLEDLLDQVLDRFGEDAEDDIAVLASRIREGPPAVRPTPPE